MKKEMIVIFLALVILPSIVIAQTNTTVDSENRIDKAYNCLENQIKEKTSFSLQDSIFGTLALGSNNKLIEKIDSEKRTNEACWPKSGCTIKDSGQVLLAYSKSGKKTDDVMNWLLSKSINAEDLRWYLEIDIQNHIASECTLKFDTQTSKIRIRDDMKLEGNPGACFVISYEGYWLEIKSSCFDKEFEISCNNDFITTLVYQKKTGGTIFVSSETHAGTSLGTTNEKVNSKCFGIGKCDYEGTLWSALALNKIGKDIEAYIPYLLVLSENNERYLPSAFIFILIAGEDKYSELIQKQKNGQYWDISGSTYNRFYDTAIALLALSGTSASELENARNYLLNVQTKEGCWNNNNIRDTGFILYAGWPKFISGISGGTGTTSCESANYFCEPKDGCLSVGGTVIEGYSCNNFRDSCCTKKVLEVTCDEKRGLICASNQKCTGTLEPSGEGSCCINGACEDIQVENLCASSGGICKTNCDSDEELLDDSCPDSGDICCREVKEEEKPKRGYTWVIILIVLILLVILGIVYRHKIQIWWHSRNSGKRAVGGSGRSPGFPGTPMRPMPGYMPRGRPAPRMTRGVKTRQDEELEETMRKLKDMSK